MDEAVAYLGLGSNLGDRATQIRVACESVGAHPQIAVERLSALYETAPVGITDQPLFLNAAAMVRTSLPPEALLDILLAVEMRMGRERNLRWGPRVIDIDLLVYGQSRIDSPRLVVPHPRLFERAFALIPLAEIAPELRPPGFACTVRDAADAAEDRMDVRYVGVL